MMVLIVGKEKYWESVVQFIGEELVGLGIWFSDSRKRNLIYICTE